MEVIAGPEKVGGVVVGLTAVVGEPEVGLVFGGEVVAVVVTFGPVLVVVLGRVVVVAFECAVVVVLGCAVVGVAGTVVGVVLARSSGWS